MMEKEESLACRLERIKRQNAELLQRHREVEADKKRAAMSQSLVQQHATIDVDDMMPAERHAMLHKNEREPPRGQYENLRVSVNQQPRHGGFDDPGFRKDHGIHSRDRKENYEPLRRPNAPSITRRGDYKDHASSRAVPFQPSPVQASNVDFGEEDIFQNVEALTPDTIIMGRSNPCAVEPEAPTYKPWESYNSSRSTAGSGRILPHNESDPPLIAQSYATMLPPEYPGNTGAPKCPPGASAMQNYGAAAAGGSESYYVPYRASSPAEGVVPATSPDQLNFLHPKDFSAPPPSFRKPPPPVYGSGRLRATSFNEGVTSGFQPNERTPAYPSNSRLSESLNTPHLGFPESNVSPEQGHSYPCAPTDTRDSFHSSSGSDCGYPGQDSEDSYDSRSDAFGGQFSAMGLPSINQMAEALGAIGIQGPTTHRPHANHASVIPSNNVFNDTFNHIPESCSQELVLNVGGIEIPKAKAEELLKQALVAAYGNAATTKKYPQNPRERENLCANFEQTNDDGTELLNLILKSSNDEPRNGLSRPVLGRGASDQIPPAKQREESFNGFASHSTEKQNHNEGRRPVLGRTDQQTSHNDLPVRQEKLSADESSGAYRPILGRGGMEPRSGPVVSDHQSEARAGTDSQGASSDDSSASSQTRNSRYGSGSEQGAKGSNVRHKGAAAKGQATARPVKKSALQARMDAVRCDTSKRFSRSHLIHSDKGGVVQMTYKGETVELISAPPPEPSKQARPVLGAGFTAESTPSADLPETDYSNPREVGRPYGGNLQPSRKPNGGVSVKYVEPRHQFSCEDVRERDKQSELLKVAALPAGDATVASGIKDESGDESLVKALEEKKSQLEEALQLTKNENITMEQTLAKLRLQKNNRVN